MKVIVLDFDGVLNYEKYLRAQNEHGVIIDPSRMALLKQIVDKTPKLCSGREDEIKAWLDRHPSVTNFVVLDDGFLGADFLKNRFVKTSNYKKGLCHSC